ncbi:MAG: hypothetical protein IKK44_00245 [Clostridium sp.]|nr:hypothetical protein [Clostridium sp.]
MDIMEKVEELVKKIKNDKDLLAKFEKDPVSVLEKLLGVDLPNDQLNKLVDGVKAKLAVDNIGDALGGLFGKK